jgi:PIN domain nuclease of toxin-antitoxin system
VGRLLDTHALLWALLEPDNLSPRAREEIEDPNMRLFVSSASAWEWSEALVGDSADAGR